MSKIGMQLSGAVHATPEKSSCMNSVRDVSKNMKGMGKSMGG